VLSRLPADVDRAGTALGLAGGLCLVALYGTTLLRTLEAPRR
jgi:hypothetical protein